MVVGVQGIGRGPVLCALPERRAACHGGLPLLAMSTLDEWLADSAEALSLPAVPIPVDLRDELLDLTRDVAHGVARIAGPLTCYLVGLAVAGGVAPATAIGIVKNLAAQRESDAEPAADSQSDAAG